MVAAKQFKYRFAAYLQPPPGSTNPPTQPDGSPWPVQVGVACSLRRVPGFENDI